MKGAKFTFLRQLNLAPPPLFHIFWQTLKKSETSVSTFNLGKISSKKLTVVVLSKLYGLVKTATNISVTRLKANYLLTEFFKFWAKTIAEASFPINRQAFQILILSQLTCFKRPKFSFHRDPTVGWEIVHLDSFRKLMRSIFLLQPNAYEQPYQLKYDFAMCNWIGYNWMASTLEL